MQGYSKEMEMGVADGFEVQAPPAGPAPVQVEVALVVEENGREEGDALKEGEEEEPSVCQGQGARPFDPEVAAQACPSQIGRSP